MSATDSYCEEHKKEKNTLYCKEEGCDKPICTFCIKNHKDHNYVDGAELGEEITEMLEKRNKDNYSKMKIVDNYSKNIEELFKFLIKRREYLIRDAEQKSKKIKKQLKEYKREIIQTTNNYLEPINIFAKECCKTASIIVTESQIENIIKKTQEHIKKLELKPVYVTYKKYFKDDDLENLALNKDILNKINDNINEIKEFEIGLPKSIVMFENIPKKSEKIEELVYESKKEILNFKSVLLNAQKYFQFAGIDESALKKESLKLAKHILVKVSKLFDITISSRRIDEIEACNITLENLNEGLEEIPEQCAKLKEKFVNSGKFDKSKAQNEIINNPVFAVKSLKNNVKEEEKKLPPKAIKEGNDFCGYCGIPKKIVLCFPNCKKDCELIYCHQCLFDLTENNPFCPKCNLPLTQSDMDYIKKNGETEAFAESSKNNSISKACSHCGDIKNGVETIDLPCNHAIHKDCMIRILAMVNERKGVIKDIKCPECNMIVPYIKYAKVDVDIVGQLEIRTAEF